MWDPQEVDGRVQGGGAEQQLELRLGCTSCTRSDACVFFSKPQQVKKWR